MTPAHTPGPWKYDGDGFDSVAAADFGSDGYVVYPMGPDDVIPGAAICELYAKVEDGEAEANAALIAAAPELLEACELLVAAMHQLDKGHHREVIFAELVISQATSH